MATLGKLSPPARPPQIGFLVDSGAIYFRDFGLIPRSDSLSSLAHPEVLKHFDANSCRRFFARLSKEIDGTTSVVTNGSRVTREWIASLNGGLDWAALSVDSVNQDILLQMGRTTRSGPMSESDYLGAVRVLREYGVRLKVNTVVTRNNLNEDLTDFIVEARPERSSISPSYAEPNRQTMSSNRSILWMGF